MVKVEKTVLIGYSAEAMFDLVDDVENYPQFLPWCNQTQVDFRDAVKTVATLHICYLGVKSHFTTQNEKKRPAEMTICLVEGPFRQLEGTWRFKPLSEQACKIEFQLQYVFSNKFLEKIVGPVFNQISNTLVDAFVRRAEIVYGASSA